jgi:hypothetical protein
VERRITGGTGAFRTAKRFQSVHHTKRPNALISAKSPRRSCSGLPQLRVIPSATNFGHAGEDSSHICQLSATDGLQWPPRHTPFKNLLILLRSPLVWFVRCCTFPQSELSRLFGLMAKKSTEAGKRKRKKKMVRRIQIAIAIATLASALGFEQARAQEKAQALETGKFHGKVHNTSAYGKNIQTTSSRGR